MIVFNCLVCDNPFTVTTAAVLESVIEGAALLCPVCGSVYAVELTCTYEGHR